MRVLKTTRFNIQRKIVASQTSESWQNIPHVSFIFEPDVTTLYHKYKEFDAGKSREEHVTFNTVVVKIITEALKCAPIMNAHIHYESKLVRGKITTYDNIDVSMPSKLPNGEMMTINMRDLGNKNIYEIRDLMHRVQEKMKNTNLNEAMYSVSLDNTLTKLREGKIIQSLLRLYGSKTNPRHKVTPLKGREKKEYEAIPDSQKLTKYDLEPGTITISNVGSITRGNPGRMAMLMVVPPQVCAIGISELAKKPEVVTDENGNDKIEVAHILPICICFDHRAMDFGDINPFMTKFREIAENPDFLWE